MSAIGTSPCPPFVRPCGVPGVLYDGNTVAWYKHNDANTVIKDGANRVSFWLDRIGYTIGAEMVNQAIWYTAAYWNTFDANWTEDAGRLHSDGNNGFAIKNNFWVIGATYKMIVTVANLVGGDFYLYDGVTVPLNMIADGTYTIYYTPGTVNLNLRSLLLHAHITALSIKRVTGNHLLQATGANQPLWSANNGLLFDGISDNMRATFALVQPEFVYLVGRQVTWTLNDNVFNGVTASVGVYDTPATPRISLFAGIDAANNLNFVLNVFAIMRALFSGAASTLQINNTAQTVGNSGANNPGGFTLGATAPVLGFYGNIEVKEVIIRRVADGATVQTVIYNYLKNANAIP